MRIPWLRLRPIWSNIDLVWVASGFLWVCLGLPEVFVRLVYAHSLVQRNGGVGAKSPAEFLDEIGGGEVLKDHHSLLAAVGKDAWAIPWTGGCHQR